MTVDDARRWIVLSSLVLTGVFFLFFLAAPALGYPLTYSQSFRLLQIVAPVFAGYLGTASRFLFGTASPASHVHSEALLGIIARGSVILFGVVIVVALAAFVWTNRSNAIPGAGMSVDLLATIFSLALGLLAVTTGVLVEGLFGKPAAAVAPAAADKQA